MQNINDTVSTVALFILGPAACGKTTLAREFVKLQLRQGRTWCLLDKDTVGSIYSENLMTSMGLDPNDRDSPAFQQHIRDKEYLTTLRIAAEQLALGIHVALPAPWGKEIKSGMIFDAKQMNFPPSVLLRHIWVDMPIDIRKQRIIARKDPRDAWKLAHWDEYARGLELPGDVQSGRTPVVDGSLSLQEQLAVIQTITCSPTPKN